MPTRSDAKREIHWRRAAGAALFVIACLSLPPAAAASVTITAAPNSSHAISPWIYGINTYQNCAGSVRNLTLNRQGGNRWTAYNWENNYSNAGNDWGPYSNDTFLSNSTTPAEAVRPVVVADRARGTASLITVQLQGYVSADAKGNVNITDPNHLASRFKQVVFKKPVANAGAFTTTPSTSDSSVYMDEFLWALDQKIPGDIYADPATPTLINLDNEPDIWASTHAEVQGGTPAVAGFIQKTIDLCKSIKDLAPAAKILGPAHYGFGGMINWQGTSGFSASYWFTDRYLADLKTASDTDGRRLLDAYDFHWYSEARGDGTRIVDLTGASLTATQVQAIVQSPRSLWDPTYRETSWVADNLGGPVRILDRIQQKIDANWPGTGIAITEYDNGGGNNIAGAIAEADNLGIFGQRSVYAACLWPKDNSIPFIRAAFRMYRDYDGNLASFGDLSIPTTSSDTSKVAAYISRKSTNLSRYVIVALNRSTTAQDVDFSGIALSGTAKIYRISGTQTMPALVGTVPVDLATWVVTLPALSVSTIEIDAVLPTITEQPTSQGVVAGQQVSLNVAATGAASYRWYKGGVAVSGATGSSLTIPAVTSAETGIYDVMATSSGGETLSAPVVLGIIPAAGERTAGSVATRDVWQNIHHPNGAVYDQFMLSGAAGTFTADPGQIARMSFLDENDSIVQVEMSGAGAITVSLAGATGPIAPALYNQSGINYMKGKATIILAGADETTHFTIYSVGTFTNPGVTRSDVPYAGWADVAVAGIVSTNGKLGGIHQGNVKYNSATGFTGIYAPTVTTAASLLVVHDIAASGSAQPYLYFGAGGTVNVKIAGGALAQPNAESITVGGLARVTMGAGQDSCGRAAAAQAIHAPLVNDAGTDVTAALVVGP